MRFSRLGEPIELDFGWPHGSFQDELRDPFKKPSRTTHRWPSGVTSRRAGCGACVPEAMKAARPPGLSTAKHLCATSPPTVSKNGVGRPAPEARDLGLGRLGVVEEVLETERGVGRDAVRADIAGSLTRFVPVI